MVQPPKILAFVFAVVFMLFIISLVFPREGIRINGHLTLQFLTIGEILEPEVDPYADISEIIDNSIAITDSAYLAMLSPSDVPVMDTVRADADSLRHHTHPIEYPEGAQSLLHPFFRTIRQAGRGGRKVRIMHYGDSQIEGDRMTSYIRYRLQEQFGGSGLGLQPAVNLYGYQLSLRHTASENWQRYTAFGNVDSTLTHTRFGVLGSFARFSPYPDSLASEAADYEAWINLAPTRRSFFLARDYRDFRLYYGNAPEPVYVELYLNDSLFDADFLEPVVQLGIRTWQFDQAPEQLEIRFTSGCSPDFYAIGMEGEPGIQVDNVALRGSAGLLFSKMDRELLQKMYDNLEVKLLILQFGGNVVPYLGEKHGQYERWFHRELSLLKSLIPGLSVIVIGVADMSIREKERYVTHPHLENINAALKQAAFRAGCAYWDMYSAMGGMNSMPSWVYAQPPLANSDFVHFNERGARVLAEMFYNALMFDYQQYVSTLP